jgi:hypothetical protein
MARIRQGRVMRAGMTADEKLTDKERRLVAHLVAGWSMQRALLAAGYSKRSVAAGGAKIIRRAHVQAVIAEAVCRRVHEQGQALTCRSDMAGAKTVPPPGSVALSDTPEEHELRYNAALLYLQMLVDGLNGARVFHPNLAPMVLDPLERLKHEIQYFLRSSALAQRRALQPPPNQLGLPLEDLDDVDSLLQEDEQERGRVLSYARTFVEMFRGAHIPVIGRSGTGERGNPCQAGSP